MLNCGVNFSQSKVKAIALYHDVNSVDRPNLVNKQFLLSTIHRDRQPWLEDW